MIIIIITNSYLSDIKWIQASLSVRGEGMGIRRVLRWHSLPSWLLLPTSWPTVHVQTIIFSSIIIIIIIIIKVLSVIKIPKSSKLQKI